MANTNVVREIEAVLPVDYLPVDISPVFRAKGGPADETLEHDCTKRPLCPDHLVLSMRRRKGGMLAYPVTVKRVTIARQDLRCYVCDKSVPR